MKLLNKLVYLHSQAQALAKYSTFNYAKDIPQSY